MRNLLIITQKVDEADDLLGFFVSWIREFASHYHRVTVITLAKGEYSLPGNVRILSLGKEAHASKSTKALRFIRMLWSEVREHDAVFAHMSPVFAIASWPFTKFWNKKLALWYLHRSHTLKLRIALAMVDTLVTADAGSLTVQSSKIVAVGHGIDIERFTVHGRTPPDGRPLRIVSVGRLSPIKGFETLIRAAANLRDKEVACDVRIVGKSVMPGDFEYEQQLHLLVSRLGVGDIVHFFGFVPYRDMPAHYRWADIVVGCTPSGGIDKVLLEGMAAGCVIVTSNTVMGKYIAPEYADQSMFRYADPADLANTIGSLLSADVSGISNDMQRAVIMNHNLSVTIGKISRIL